MRGLGKKLQVGRLVAHLWQRRDLRNVSQLMMPLILGFMFYGMSSGLVLYWLTGNLVGIAQQWFFNKTSVAPVPPPPPVKQAKKGAKK